MQISYDHSSRNGFPAVTHKSTQLAIFVFLFKLFLYCEFGEKWQDPITSDWT